MDDPKLGYLPRPEDKGGVLGLGVLTQKAGRAACGAAGTRVLGAVANAVAKFERVVLTRDVPEENPVAGDVGTVVQVYGAREGFEVEFLTPSGRTIAVATLDADDVREAGEREVLHVRAV